MLMVCDVETTLRFYRDVLGFKVESAPGDDFGSLTRGNARDPVALTIDVLRSEEPNGRAWCSILADSSHGEAGRLADGGVSGRSQTWCARALSAVTSRERSRRRRHGRARGAAPLADRAIEPGLTADYKSRGSRT